MSVDKGHKLSAEEERRLIRIVQKKGPDNTAALKKLIDVNRRGIVRAVNCHLRHGAEMDLLMQAGIGGFIEGVEKYEESHGIRLSTYTNYYVLGAGEISCAEQLGITKHVHQRMIEIAKCRAKYFAEHGANPDVDAIARGMGLLPGTVKRILSRIDKIRSCFHLEEHLGGGMGDITFAEVIPSSEPDPEACVVSMESGIKDAVRVDELLMRLTPRERQVIEFRYGLKELDQEPGKKKGDKNTVVSLETVGDVIGASTEGVRQIELRALQKMKRFARQRIRKGIIRDNLADQEKTYKVNACALPSISGPSCRVKSAEWKCI